MVVEFVTQHPQTSAATDADALPVGTVVLNGIDDAAVVTVANKATGVYKATFTPPTLTTGDILALRVAATVAAVAGVGVVWQQQVVGGGAGSGAIEFPITINDADGNPLDGVEVWITTDSAGSNVVAGTLSTNASGLVTFMLDAGTYYCWRQLSGYNFTNPVTLTVA